MAFCAACGQEVGGASFCPKCGAAQAGVPAAGSPPVSSLATGTDGLAENVRGVQAENGNLIAARAGVGDDGEIIDFIDGDTTGSGGGACRRGGYVAGSQRNFLEDSEVDDVRSDTCAAGDAERIGTRAGIENRHGNGYVNFISAHEGKIAQRT